MKICIKNMVCSRCKTVVKQELEKLGLKYSSIDLGHVEVDEEVSKEKLVLLNLQLKESGLEIIECKMLFLAEQIKIAIIERIFNDEENVKINFSDYLAKKLKNDYMYLSRLFLNSEGITIHQYIIAQKIERVKELLMYGELNLSQIAYKLNYSSVAHLSNQFKKTTGCTPSSFLNSKKDPRYPVDQVSLYYRKRAKVF